jgi:hypothetical protein
MRAAGPGGARRGGSAYAFEDDGADGGSENDPEGRVDDGADHVEAEESAIADLS